MVLKQKEIFAMNKLSTIPAPALAGVVKEATVRAALAAHDTELLEKFLPETTARYLQEKLSLY